MWKKLGEEITNSEFKIWEGIENQKSIYDGFYITKTGSVEHIQPQIKCNENGFSENAIHNFGNLALISGGRNSSLRDKDVDIKKIYVMKWIEKGESIQSLKMLLALEKYPNWNCENSFKHREKMIELLKDSLN